MNQQPLSEVVANMTVVDVLDVLAERQDKLSPKNKDFSRSLLAYYNTHKKLSEKQEYWARVILNQSYLEKAEKEVVSVGNMGGLYTLFQKAKQKLKYPAITLKTEEGKRVKINPFGNGSKYKGKLCVTDGKPFGQNIFYGAVSQEGAFEVNPHHKNVAVENLLVQMSHDPVAAAKQYATLTGKCCFCNLPLSDEKSTAVGFGPVCAKHFGLEEAWKKGVSLFEALSKEV